MEPAKFYEYLLKFAPELQVRATKLTQNPDEARGLYLDTVYKAEKNFKNLRRDIDFKNWIMPIMESTSTKGTFSSPLASF